jgi:hypothetical protein
VGGSLSLSLSLSCDHEFEIRNLEVGSKSVCLELCNPQFCLGLFHRLRKKKKKELGWAVGMKSTSAVGGVVVGALRRVLCILVLVVVVVSEPTTTPVQGKPEDKSNGVEATRESTLQTVQNAVDKTGNKQKRFFTIKEIVSYLRACKIDFMSSKNHGQALQEEKMVHLRTRGVFFFFWLVG